MVQWCCVRNCKSSRDAVSFHRFPIGQTLLDLERKRLWIEAVQRDINFDYALICGRHFVTGKPAKFNENSEPNWVPTLELNHVVLPVEAPTHLLCSPMEKENVCGAAMDTSVGDDIGQGDYDETNETVYEEWLNEEMVSTFNMDQLPTSSSEQLPKLQYGCGDDDLSADYDETLHEEWLDDDMGSPFNQEQFPTCNSEQLPELQYGCGADYDETLHEEWLDDDMGSPFNQEQFPTSSFIEPPTNAGNEGQTVSQLISKFEEIIRKKKAEVRDLKSIVNSQQQVLEGLQYDLKFLENDDKKTCHFTGIPNFSTLSFLYDFVHEAILPVSAILSKQQIFVMVLMRLRLNLSFKTLGYLYRVSVTTACKYFYSGLYALYQQLKGLIKWPSKELLKAYTPLKFKKAFPNEVVTSIIDCFEIFTEKPGTKDTALKMYSNYKHSYTVKVLISITPFGTVSFVSKPYTGRTSDKFITETCGYMDYVKENDIILADRGFTVQKAINDKKATLRVPDSASRKRQLSAVAVERTRALASVRNEVERSIGALRGKYRILKGPIPVTMVNHQHNGINVLHMVVTVCCALVNLCPPIIK